MATGKNAKDIFTRTVNVPEVGLEVAPRVTGRPTSEEPYSKVTVCLYDRQTIWLDEVALAIRKKTGQRVARAELIRAIVDQAAGSLDPGQKGFDKAVQRLFPAL